jgi:hypothetical protein
MPQLAGYQRCSISVSTSQNVRVGCHAALVPYLLKTWYYGRTQAVTHSRSRLSNKTWHYFFLTSFTNLREYSHSGKSRGEDYTEFGGMSCQWVKRVALRCLDLEKKSWSFSFLCSLFSHSFLSNILLFFPYLSLRHALRLTSRLQCHFLASVATKMETAGLGLMHDDWLELKLGTRREGAGGG